MYLKKLVLKDFRNYENKEIEFGEGVTILLGKNGVGKTNLIEAVELLSSGESWRAFKIDEMIRIGAEFGRVMGWVEEEELEMMLTRGSLQGKRVNKRIYKVNGNGKRKGNFIGKLITVLFQPDDLQIVIGGHEWRRRWMDGVLTKIDREYGSSLHSYREGLKRRNRLLAQIREGNTSEEGLEFWDRLILKHGEIIQTKREGLIEWMNRYLKEKQWELKLEYERSLLTEDKLRERRPREIATGFTLGGPHRDGVKILNGGDLLLSSYGSRGQQRLGVLWLKMGERDYLEEAKQERALLLLDDVFSELDEENDKLVAEMVEGRQTIITATEINRSDLREAEIINL